MLHFRDHVFSSKLLYVCVHLKAERSGRLMSVLPAEFNRLRIASWEALVDSYGTFNPTCWSFKLHKQHVFVFFSPLSLHSTALDDVHAGLFVQHSSFSSLYYMTNATVVTCILKQRLILLITLHPCDRPDWEKCLLARKHARRQLG